MPFGYWNVRCYLRSPFRKKKNFALSSKDVKTIYEIAKEYVGVDSYLYQQMANYERIIPNGDLQLAEEYLRAARASNPRDESIVHSQAVLAVARSREAKHSLEREKFRNQAFSFLDDLMKDKKSESDRYARTTYLQLAVDNLRYTINSENLTERDLQDIVRDTEKMLQSAKQRYPDDTFVNDAEAQIASLIDDDDKRALKALKSAFETNPRDIYIAKRLSHLYKKKRELNLAASCLKKILESENLSKELNYDYAQILRDIDPTDIENITYYFSRSRSKGDQNYPAQFWYARYLFENSDLEKINESKKIFKQLRNSAIRYDTRIKIQDCIRNATGKTLFSGGVSSLQTEHGFVTVDGRGDDVFFHRNDVKTNDWEALKTGSRISFNIGFTFSGPIAMNISSE